MRLPSTQRESQYLCTAEQELGPLKVRQQPAGAHHVGVEKVSTGVLCVLRAMTHDVTQFGNTVLKRENFPGADSGVGQGRPNPTVAISTFKIFLSTTITAYRSEETKSAEGVVESRPDLCTTSRQTHLVSPFFRIVTAEGTPHEQETSPNQQLCNCTETSYLPR